MKNQDKLKQIGTFRSLTWVPGEMEGNNFVRKLHEHFNVLGFDMPVDIGIRLIEIPPNGEIPMHSHKTDDFSSWIICMNGNGKHIVAFGDTVYEHDIMGGGGSVSTQKMIADLKHLEYKHSFKAGPYGMTLLNIYRASQISNERLKKIHEGE
jgi:hypothetical protein